MRFRLTLGVNALQIIIFLHYRDYFIGAVNHTHNLGPVFTPPLFLSVPHRSSSTDLSSSNILVYFSFLYYLLLFLFTFVFPLFFLCCCCCCCLFLSSSSSNIFVYFHSLNFLLFLFFNLPTVFPLIFFSSSSSSVLRGNLRGFKAFVITFATR